MSRKETELFISEFEQRMKEIRDNPEIDKFKKDLHSFLRNQNINLFFSAKTYFENNRDSGVFKKKGYSDDILNDINSALEYRTLKIEEVAQKNPKKAIILCLALIQVNREKIRLLEKNKTSLTEEETEASVSQLSSSIESLNESLTESEEAIMKSPEASLKELRENLEDYLDLLPDAKRILLTLSIKSEQAVQTVISSLKKLRKMQNNYAKNYLNQKLLQNPVKNSMIY